MSISRIQAAVTARVWQSIAQSGIDISGVDQETMNRLVDMVVQAALEEVDTQIGAAAAPAATPQTPSTDEPAPAAEEADQVEEILWEGRPFLSFTVHYTITNERLRIVEGLFGKHREDIELVRVQDMDFKQSVTERALNIGDILITSHDPSRPQVVLENVRDPEQVHETLRRAVLNARQKHRLHYREEM